VIATELQPVLKPIAFLLGTWRGEGSGEYPTIQPFHYREEVRFTHTGKTFLVYTQRTEALDDGRPLHSEAGYLRSLGDGRLELVIAQPIGFAEIELGTVTGNRIELSSTQVLRTPTAKPVTAIARKIWLEGERLHYELGMALGDAALTHHLSAALVRVS
jgi:hypothetical protein